MITLSASSTTDAPETTRSTGCPLTAAWNAIGVKGNMTGLYWLESGTHRFNELQRLKPDMSHKVLAETLRNLEQQGPVIRTQCPEVPPRVEYELSTHGETVLPLIEAVRRWGRAHI
jgi:DNA-binding HxlR family transcriptional regulator